MINLTQPQKTSLVRSYIRENLLTSLAKRFDYDLKVKLINNVVTVILVGRYISKPNQVIIEIKTKLETFMKAQNFTYEIKLIES
jgi:hypothetical protein